MSDRRTQPRFEIVGRLRGSIASPTALPLVNVSAGGALIESPWPLAPDSIYSVRLKSGAGLHDVKVRVRHVRATWKSGEQRYLVGVEFVSPEGDPHEQPHL